MRPEPNRCYTGLTGLHAPGVSVHPPPSANPPGSSGKSAALGICSVCGQAAGDQGRGKRSFSNMQIITIDTGSALVPVSCMLACLDVAF